MGDRNLFPPEALKRNNGVNMCLLLGFSPGESAQARQRGDRQKEIERCY